MNTFASRLLPRLVLALLAFCLAGSAAADWADDVGQVQRLVNRGQYAEAEQFASDSLKRGPGSVLFAELGTLTLHYWRGRVRLHLGNTAGVIEDAEALIKANSYLMPPDVGYNLRAMARAVQGDASGAMADFEAGLASARSGFVTGMRTAGLLGDRAVARVLLNDIEGAKGDLTRALETEQSALAMGDFIAAKRESWSRQREALAKLQAGDGRGAVELAQAASQVLVTVKGPSTAGEVITAGLFLAEMRRREAGASDLAATGAPARPVDPAILELLTNGPQQDTGWGIEGTDAPGGGLLVRELVSGYAAQAGGVLVGDVVQAVDGVPVRDAKHWQALTQSLPLYTPLRVTVARAGSPRELTFSVPGRVRLNVKPFDPEFHIPGAIARAQPPSTALEALDAFNVLERVVIDPATGKVAAIGRYDPQFKTGPLPYLDLLKSALEQPTPRLNIWPTEETARLLEALRPEITAKLRDFPFSKTVSHVMGHPELERDRQLLVRELARLYGITPQEYAAWTNYSRMDVQRDDYTSLLPPPPLQPAIIQAHRSLGFPQAAQALGLMYQQTPQALVQALHLLGQGEQASQITSRSGDQALGPLNVAAWIALSEVTGTLSPEVRKGLRGLYDDGKIPWQRVVRSMQVAQPTQPAKGVFSLMHQAFTRMHLSNPAALLAFPKLEGARSRMEPIDLEPNTQLARVLFEADYAFKVFATRHELLANIPGFKLRPEFAAANPNGGDAKAGRIWMEPQSVEMTVAPSRSVVDFGAARMVVRAADASDLIDFKNKDFDKADLYMEWSAGHLMGHYDDYARVIPAFHEVREVAKVIALAQWLRAQDVRVDMSEVAQTPWDAPETFPLISALTQSARVLPNGTSELTTYLIVDGGVSFKPRGNWTVVAPSAQSETRATDHLSLSAGLGRLSVKALGDGDLEQARHLAELSAQAMNGGLSKADLDKRNIVVPEVKGFTAGPAQVQLQKEVLRQTSQQIEALQRDPNARAQAQQAAARLSSVYEDVGSNPVSASDYLLKLQMGRTATQAPASSPAVASPPSPPEPPAPSAVAGTLRACTVQLLPQERSKAESQRYLSSKLDQARNRLRFIQEALRKLIAINAKQQAEIQKLTGELSQAYDAATERAYDFAVSTLTDLPLAKYADIHKSRIRELDNLIKGQRLARTRPMSESARLAIDNDILQMTRLKDAYEAAFSSTERMLTLYQGANYAKDIYKWEQDTHEAGDWKRGWEATRLGAKILLDLPWLEDKFLPRQQWFGGNKLWQVTAMGKMAWTASDFFWDIMNQQFAWQPLANQLLHGMKVNTQAMDDLRQKAQATLKEIDCLQRLVQQ